MFDLVPFAGVGWKMADRSRDACLVCELLQLKFPKAQALTAAPTAVDGDQYPHCIRIDPSPFLAPPSANGCDRKRSRVVIGADIDKARVAPNVINAVRIGTGNVGSRKVMTLNLYRLPGGKPLLARVVVVADEFFLFGIHGNDRAAFPQASSHGGTDVPKLGVAIRMIFPFLGLPIALQAVVEVVKDLGHLRMTDRVFVASQFFSDGPRALANLTQRRLRIPPGLDLDHFFQLLHQPRVRNRKGLASGSGPADAAGGGRETLFDFTDSFRDCLARQSTGTTDHTDSTMAQRSRFTGGHNPPRSFIQQGPYRPEFLSQFGQRIHARAA